MWPVEELKYLGTKLTDQNSIQEEIKSRLKLGNACCHSMQNILLSSLLSKNLKIEIYRTIRTCNKPCRRNARFFKIHKDLNTFMTICILAFTPAPSTVIDNFHMHSKLPYVFFHAIYVMHNHGK
jgi:hypothetical protein